MLFNFFKDGEYTPQSQQVIKSRFYQTLTLISQRSQINNWAIVILYLVSLWATPIYRKFPSLAIQYGVALFVIAAILFILSDQKYRFKSEKLWAMIFVPLTILLSLLWGLLSAWSIYNFNLSWTSFFITLMTLAVTSTYSVVYSANMKLFQALLVVTIFPAIYVNSQVISGQSGDAIGLFLIGFGGLLSYVGKSTNKNFWKLTMSMQRMQGLIQAIPGTLCWLNSDFRFIGSNPKFMEVLKIDGKINEKNVEVDHPLHSLSTEIFNSTGQVSSSISLDRHTYYFAGQKYNNDHEAVIIGMDITEQHMWQGVVEKERVVAIEEAKLAELGRMLPVFTTYMDAHIQNDHSRKIIHYLSPDDNDNHCVGIEEIFEFIDELYSHYVKRNDFKIIFSTSEAGEEVFPVKSLFITLCILIQNSIEAGGTNTDHRIQISHENKEGIHYIDVEDNGSGVPEEYEDVLFEPQISTKSNRMGIGLSLAQDLVHDMGGTISLTSPRSPTRFTIKVKEGIIGS